MYSTYADKGTHDWLIDQLIYNEGGENGLQIPNTLTNGEESTHEEDRKCKTDGKRWVELKLPCLLNGISF